MSGSTNLNLLESIAGKKKQYRLVSKGNVQAVLEKIKNVRRCHSFAKLLSSDEEMLRLFSLHWSQVTALEEVSVPVLFSLQIASEDAETVVSREAKKEEEKTSFTVEKVLSDARPQIDRFVKKMVGKLQSSGAKPDTLDESQVIAVLLKSMGLFSMGSPLSAMVNMLKPFEDFVADDALDVVVSVLGASKSQVLEFGLSRRERVLKGTELDDDTYESLLARLVEDEYAKPLLTILWCEGHRRNPTSFYVAGHRDIPIVRCDTCNRDLNYGTFLYLAPPAMTLTRHYEGTLLYLIAWILEQAGNKWNSQVYLEGEGEDTEKDIVYASESRDEIVVVECKTFATDVPDRTVATNLRKSLKQLAMKVNSLQKKDVKVSSAVLATNYVVKSGMRKKTQEILKQKTYSSLRKTKLVLIDPSNLNELPGVQKGED